MRLLGNKIAIEVICAGPIVLLGTVNEAMGVSVVEFYFSEGLLACTCIKVVKLLTHVPNNLVVQSNLICSLQTDPRELTLCLTFSFAIL